MQKGFMPTLTWGGLRGGISVTMVLSLPNFEAKDILLICTYAIVLFLFLSKASP
jgi:CPA1 family monovalent cation:H+ antiporter